MNTIKDRNSKKYKTIFTDKQKCFLCNCTNGLEIHHIMNGPSRKRSEKDGLVCYLCNYHHYLVHHGGKDVDNFPVAIKLKMMAKDEWKTYYNKSDEDWLRTYHKNYAKDM